MRVRALLFLLSLILSPGGLHAAAFRMAPPGVGSNLAPFQVWLRSPQGMPLLRANPHMRWLADLDLKNKNGLTAVAPLVERLPAGTLTRLSAIARLSNAEQSGILQSIDKARQEAAGPLEVDVLAAVADLKDTPDWEGSQAARELEDQIKGFGFYSPAVRAAYKGLRRRNTERAMRSAHRDARALLRSFPLEETVIAGGMSSGGKISRPLLPRKALSPSQFYDSSHWGNELIPDRSYARALSAAAGLLAATDLTVTLEQNAAMNAKLDLAATMRAKDPKIHSHMMRVGLLAGLIAWEMGFSDDIVQRVAWGARIHDLGKIEEDIRSVVNKEGKLSAEERRIMERHPAAGAKLIENDEKLDVVSRRIGAIAALNHHETYDGKGYPRAIPGEEIPLVARITNVADYYDALMENRPYRKGMTSAEALAIMEKASAKFDAQVWKALLRLIN